MVGVRVRPNGLCDWSIYLPFYAFPSLRIVRQGLASFHPHTRAVIQITRRSFLLISNEARSRTLIYFCVQRCPMIHAGYGGPLTAPRPRPWWPRQRKARGKLSWTTTGRLQRFYGVSTYVDVKVTGEKRVKYAKELICFTIRRTPLDCALAEFEDTRGNRRKLIPAVFLFRRLARYSSIRGRKYFYPLQRWRLSVYLIWYSENMNSCV